MLTLRVAALAAAASTVLGQAWPCREIFIAVMHYVLAASEALHASRLLSPNLYDTRLDGLWTGLEAAQRQTGGRLFTPGCGSPIASGGRAHGVGLKRVRLFLSELVMPCAVAVRGLTADCCVLRRGLGGGDGVVA